ncbi:hypothetical protein F5888DRAFT_1635508 [Russula emetica]|nr:hypothetical protein F5888DRAFT_1635508 [Russula emetica]
MEGPPALSQCLGFFFSCSRAWAGRDTSRILRPGNAAANPITQGVIYPPGATVYSIPRRYSHLHTIRQRCSRSIVIPADHVFVARNSMTRFATRPYGLPKPFWTKSSIEAVRNVPDWFAFTPLDTVYAGRCGGEDTGTCVPQSLEDAARGIGIVITYSHAAPDPGPLANQLMSDSGDALSRILERRGAIKKDNPTAQIRADGSNVMADLCGSSWDFNMEAAQIYGWSRVQGGEIATTVERGKKQAKKEYSRRTEETDQIVYVTVIGDPTTMLAHSAVEVEAARTMGAHGRRFKSMFIGVASTPSTITWLLFPKAAPDIQAEAAVPSRCTEASRH